MQKHILSTEQALAALHSGKTIRNTQLPYLHIRDEVFDAPIRIEDSVWEGFLFEDCTFRANVTMEYVDVTHEAVFSQEGRPSSFEQNLILDRCCFKQKVMGRKLHVGGRFSCQEAVFEERIAFPKANFAQAFNANDACFKSSSRWEGASFAHAALFEGCRFEGKADFRKAIFENTAFFRAAHFVTEATFQNAVFQSGRFDEVVAHDFITFKVVQFHKKVYFHNATFHGKLVLRGVSFRDVCYFNHVTCHREIDAQGMEAFSTATFDHSTFHGDVDFSDTVFHQDVNIRHSEFHGTFHMLESVLRMRLDGIGTRFHGPIGLYGVNANELLLSKQQLSGKIDSVLQGNFEQAKHVYVMLRNQFEMRGQHEDADWAYYLFRQAERKANREPGWLPATRRFFDWFLFDLGSGYGTKPLNVTLLAAFVIVMFAGVYWLFPQQFVIEAALRGQASTGLSLAQALYISASTFISIKY